MEKEIGEQHVFTCLIDQEADKCSPIMTILFMLFTGKVYKMCWELYMFVSIPNRKDNYFIIEIELLD